MGIADDVTRRHDDRRGDDDANRGTSSAYLELLGRHLDELAPEVAEAAKKLDIRRNTNNLLLRGWYLSWADGIGLVIRANGRWVWANYHSGSARALRETPNLRFGAEPTYGSTRARLVDELDRLAGRF